MTRGILDRGPALLFCPGDRPDRFEKAVERSDIVILDLEDAVDPGSKDAARATVAEALSTLADRAIVRINDARSPWFAADVREMRAAGARTVMVPKVCGSGDLSELEGFDVVAICETAQGVASSEQIARSPQCSALFWGGEDLIADLGGRSSRDSGGRYRPVIQHARSRVLLAAAAAGIPAIDAIEPDIDALDRLAESARNACDEGFAAVACIHPSHVGPIRAAFAPAPEQLEWAHGVLDAATAASGGAFRFQGRMIDSPLLAQARNILRKDARWTSS